MITTKKGFKKIEEMDYTKAALSNTDSAFNVNVDQVETLLDGKADAGHDHNAAYEPKNANVQAHIANKSNPHGVTKEQLGAAASGHTHTPASLGAAESGHNHDAAYEPKNTNVQTHIASKGNPHGATPSDIGAATASHTHPAATTGADGLMSKADKAKLDGVAVGANNYVLPVAGAAPGGVKSGTDISVDAAGNVSVNDDSHNHIIGNVDGLQGALDAKAASEHEHNAAYEPKNTNIQGHIASRSNPHGVTAAQVGAVADALELTASTNINSLNQVGYYSGSFACLASKGYPFDGATDGVMLQQFGMNGKDKTQTLTFAHRNGLFCRTGDWAGVWNPWINVPGSVLIYSNPNGLPVGQYAPFKGFYTKGGRYEIEYIYSSRPYPSAANPTLYESKIIKICSLNSGGALLPYGQSPVFAYQTDGYSGVRVQGLLRISEVSGIAIHFHASMALPQGFVGSLDESKLLRILNIWRVYN